MRGKEHKKGYEKKKKGNPMWEHDKEFHGGRGETEFKIENLQSIKSSSGKSSDGKSST